MSKKTASELEVLSKYLTTEELKEIAKEVAKEAFKSSIGAENPHSKENIQYFTIQGAMMAMRDAIDPIRSELQPHFNDRILKAINGLSYYSIIGNKTYRLDEMINNALSVHETEITKRVNKIIEDGYLNPGAKYSDELYRAVYDRVGDNVNQIINEALELKYKQQD